MILARCQASPVSPPHSDQVLSGIAGHVLRHDFERLAALLRGLQGRFILSLNDVPEVRDIFAGFRIERGAAQPAHLAAAGDGAELFHARQQAQGRYPHRHQMPLAVGWS